MAQRTSEVPELRRTGRVAISQSVAFPIAHQMVPNPFSAGEKTLSEKENYMNTDSSLFGSFLVILFCMVATTLGVSFWMALTGMLFTLKV